jgi:hypothetical protein
MVHSLEKRKPPDMTQRQWDNAFGWTANLWGNTQALYSADVSDLQQLEREMNEKLKGKVDFNTILWIWDRFAEVCTGAKRYNEIYRDELIDFSSPEGSKRSSIG